MTMRKLLAVLLALAMVLSIPLAVSADDWKVVNTTLGAAKSEPLPLTQEPKTWTFVSTTNADAGNNWDTAAIDVTSSAAWEMTIRSDCFAGSEENGWGTAGEDAFGGKAYPADWAAWLEANKAGAPCKVTAQVVDGAEADYIVVAFSNNGVVNTYCVPTVGSLDSVALYLTGENSVLTGLAESTEHLDISACVSYLKGEEEWKVVNTTLGAAKSEPLPLTQEPKTWTFVSTTNADAGNNWDTAAIDVTSSAAWEMTIRSDCFAVSEENGWGTAGEDAFGGKGYPADWAAWLEANKAGAVCKVTAQVVDGTDADYIVIAFSNNGVTNTYIVPTAGALDSVALYLTGENSVLTKLAESADHIDISAAVESVSPQEQPEEPTEPSEPEVPEEDWIVDSPAWWGAHSAPVEITEDIQSWNFICTMYEEGGDYYDTATAVIFRSDDGTLSGPNYLEELLVRSDCYAVSEEAYWGTDGQPTYATKNYPADWDAWVAANKAGAECTITAQIVDGWIIIGLTNAGVTNVYSVPMNTDLTSGVYLSMTGEQCVLTGWESTDNHVDISDAVSAPADGNNPKTGDLLPMVAAILALLSVAGIVVLNKKRMAL